MIRFGKCAIMLTVSALCWPAPGGASENDQEEWLIVPKDLIGAGKDGPRIGTSGHQD